MKVSEGSLVVKNKKFGVVVSRFNDFVTKSLLEGCCDTLLRHGAKANTLYNMSLSVDQVQASAGIMPMNGIWSAQVGGTYDIFNNSFRVTSDVRVWNLTVGASTNLKDKNQVQVVMFLVAVM